MGINEHGVAIGNEAVFTKESYERGVGLLGMRLIDTPIERCRARDLGSAYLC